MSIYIFLCVCVLSKVPLVWLRVAAAAEELKEWSIKLPHSLSLIKCVTCFADEFWVPPPGRSLLGFSQYFWMWNRFPRSPLRLATPCPSHLFSFISTQLSVPQIKRGQSLVLALAKAFEAITSTLAEFPGSQTAACRPPLTKAAGLRVRLISVVRSIWPCQCRRRRQPSWGRLGLSWSLLYFGRINKKPTEAEQLFVCK